MLTGKRDPSARSNRVSSTMTLCWSAMARRAGSRRNLGVSTVRAGRPSRVTVAGRPSMVAPAGFTKLISPAASMVHTPSPRLPVTSARRSFWRSMSA